MTSTLVVRGLIFVCMTYEMALSLTAVADRLHVSRRTVERWVRAGLLPSVKIGGRRLVPVAELQRVLSDREHPSPLSS